MLWLSKNSKNSQRYIYVLLSRTHTVPARLIRLFTNEPYSHVSIALDVELNDLYSFARKEIHNPFDCGFVEEDIESGIFGLDRSILCKVYEIPVTNEQYSQISNEIQHFIKNKEDYRYNYTGLVGIMFGKNVVDGTHFFCSQFVSHVFFRSGIKLFSKETGLIRPFDFHMELKDKQIYDGRLCEYRQYVKRRNQIKISESKKGYAEAI